MSEGDGVRKRLRESLTAALKAKDAAGVAAMRSALSAIANAEAVAEPSTPVRGHVIAKARLGVGAAEAARRDLSEGDAIAVIHAEIDERLDAAAKYEQLGQAEHALKLRSEAEALSAVVTAR